MTKTKAFFVFFFIAFLTGLSFYFWRSGLVAKLLAGVTGDDQEPAFAPSFYQIENAPFYGEENWCWGSSAMMLLIASGFTDEKIQEARSLIKAEGRGGPPDIFIAFREYGLLDDVRIAYSKDCVKEYADFYSRQLLADPEKQLVLFNNEDEAIRKLKELISSDTLVVIVGHYGNHYLVVTGYDDNYIYLNDPGADKVFFEKVDYQDDYQKETRMLIGNFLEQWTVSGFEGGGIGFPGDWGMIWLEN
jgi:hypothetical protein